MPNARQIAVKALVSVDAQGGYSNIVLDRLLKEAKLSSADAALASALFYGVLDRKITLDYLLQKHCSRSMSKLSDGVRNALRIGAFQLLYMDRVPAFAAINESVNIVKRSKDKYASGLVNAVLRGLERAGAPSLPSEQTAQALSVRASCAEWLVKRLVDDYGFETAEKIFASGLEPSATYLRVNALKTDADRLVESLSLQGCEAEAVDGVENAVRLLRGSAEGLDGYRDGLFHVQDLSSQRCCAALQTERGMRALDVCAAPGGKSFTVAELMQGQGEVVSRDLHSHRVELIRNGAERLGLNNVTASVGDATVFDETLGSFDRVLCDVPCSGVGVIRRKPEIKYKDAFDADKLFELQLKILTTSAGYLKSGGRLVYSTCTLLKKENREVVDAFLKANSDFFLVGEDITLMPFEGTDGFYFACLQRR